MPNTPATSVDEFRDPLENYDPLQFDDPLEQALHDESVKAIQSTPVSTITPDTTIGDALDRLVHNHIACLLVEEDDRLVGIVSDRDILNHAALEFDEVKDRPVREVMTADPVSVRAGDSAAAALSVMAVSGFRHVPVIDNEDRIVGIISPQRVTRFLLDYAKVAV